MKTTLFLLGLLAAVCVTSAGPLVDRAVTEAAKRNACRKAKDGKSFRYEHKIVVDNDYYDTVKSCSFTAYRRTVRYNCRGPRHNRKCKTKTVWSDNFSKSKLRRAERSTGRNIDIFSEKFQTTKCTTSGSRGKKVPCKKLTFKIKFGYFS